MDLQRINQHKQSFDDICQYIQNEDDSEKIEVWFARELQTVLGYTRWENFQAAISRAVESCKTQNVNVDDHFREVTKMITLGKGGQREIQDYMLTRYACYLIAQNGDPKKEEIALTFKVADNLRREKVHFKNRFGIELTGDMYLK